MFKNGYEIVLRALVKDCNLRRMASIISLFYFGLTYPIMVSLDKEREDEQSKRWFVT